MGSLDRAKLALVSNYVSLGPRAQVLDVGCGAGSFLMQVRERFGSAVAGVDFVDLSSRPAFRGVEFHHGLFYDQEVGRVVAGSEQQVADLHRALLAELGELLQERGIQWWRRALGEISGQAPVEWSSARADRVAQCGREHGDGIRLSHALEVHRLEISR